MNAQTQELTPASMWQDLAGRPISDELLEWPADLFSLTDVILGRSEVYRFILSARKAAQRPLHIGARAASPAISVRTTTNSTGNRRSRIN